MKHGVWNSLWILYASWIIRDAYQYKSTIPVEILLCSSYFAIKSNWNMVPIYFCKNVGGIPWFLLWFYKDIFYNVYSWQEWDELVRRREGMWMSIILHAPLPRNRNKWYAEPYGDMNLLTLTWGEKARKRSRHATINLARLYSCKIFHKQ